MQTNDLIRRALAILTQLLIGLVPIIVGVLLATGLIALILYNESNILDVTVDEITLVDEPTAQLARERMEQGASVMVIAEELGDQVDDVEAGRLLNQSMARRLPTEAAEALFTSADEGTIIGPYEARNGWYIAQVQAQTRIGVTQITDLIDERILSNPTSRVGVIDFWLPIFLCSCGLLLTFTAGLWNIGIEGQVGMGAVGAASIALFVDLPRTQLIITELAMAAAAGGAWALFTAVMRTRGGVNEIFGGVAMNFIASNFSAYLLVGPWAPPNSSGSATARFPDNAILPRMTDYALSPTTIYIAVASYLFVLLTLSGSKWGLQLRAMGKNAKSARTLGVAAERNIWLAMTICGMMAGLAGGHMVLFTRSNLPANVSGGLGFLALLVVLLASIRVLWVPFISLTFALLLSSRLPIQLRLQLDPSLIGVFVGVMVFSVFIIDGVRQRALALAEARRVAAAKTQQEAGHGSGSD